MTFLFLSEAVCVNLFWREIDAPRFIVDTIEFGYKLPLLQIPPPFVTTNNNSALQESKFVESGISKLLSLECITGVFAPPEVINPLSVSIQKSGKKRLILDLRHLNQYLFNPSFDEKMFQLPGKCLAPGISCFLSILSRDPTMLRFSLNTGNIFRFLGSFLPASPGIFNLQSCPLVLVPHLICLLSFSSH